MTPLLDTLLQEGLITPPQAQAAENRMKRTGSSPEDAVLSLELCPPDALYAALSRLSGIPLAPPEELTPSPDALGKVPQNLAARFQALPLSLKEGLLQMAFAHPPAANTLEQLHLMLGVPCQPFLAPPAVLETHRRKAYGLGAEKVRKIRTRIQETLPSARQEEEKERQEAAARPPEDSSVAGLVEDILSAAFDARATDIHLEPFAQTIKLRFRVDGLLQDVPVPPGMETLGESILARIKVLAKMDIAEKRLPQDGRLQILREGAVWDIRVSTLPTRYGETLCLRLLNAQALLKDMGALGLSPEHLEQVRHQMSRPSGLILVTGPTGSGKTTTLYSILTHLMENRKDLKLITVEDPVEYDIPGLTQVQTHGEIGLTFSTTLRSILRHDPNVILVGEIRDAETADIAIQAAMTGHLVLSTLHTSDAVGAINRLIAMGVEPDLVASSLRMVVAQRLVRRLCPHCSVPDHQVSPQDARDLANLAKSHGLARPAPRRASPRGCIYCQGTGYLGRVGVYEILEVQEKLEDLISARTPNSLLREEARKEGWFPYSQDALEKVLLGLTDLAEVHRCC
ncbi:MAG: GspE/PulE family protein [Oligosphaeraceae bacterium]